jgi:hypothetical protein
MGDIIFTFFLLLLILFVFILYHFFTRKKIEQRRLTHFISILLVIGGIIGIALSGLNEKLRNDHPFVYSITLVFFIAQTLAALMYLTNVKLGLPLLILTLVFQAPIFHSSNFSFSNQTLFSVRIQTYPGNWDIEPGSYLHFVYLKSDFIDVHSFDEKYGLNLIPLLLITILWLKEKQRKIEVSQSPSS